MASFNDVAAALQNLLEEQGTPRNVREKVQGMILAIRAPGDSGGMKADKLLMQLDDLQSDVNIPTYVRTQLWSVSSMLEDLDE
jgi:uncharacterized protein (UPF0147 family)